MGDNLERTRDVKNDYINLSYEALFDQNSWPIEIMCTGTNEHQNPGANSAESDFVFSAKERMGTSKYKSGDNLYILRGYLNKYESSHNDIWYMGCLIFCQLENPGPGIFLRNLQPKYIVGWKNENSRIDLYISKHTS